MASVSHRSISFPAIGTGTQGLGKRDVAHTMIKAVTAFVEDQPRRLDVCFVIYPNDRDMFKVGVETDSLKQPHNNLISTSQVLY